MNTSSQLYLSPGGANITCSQNTCSTVLSGYLMLALCPLEQPVPWKSWAPVRANQLLYPLLGGKKRSKSTRQQLNSLSPAIVNISEPKEAVPSYYLHWQHLLILPVGGGVGFAVSLVSAYDILTVLKP